MTNYDYLTGLIIQINFREEFAQFEEQKYISRLTYSSPDEITSCAKSNGLTFHVV